MKKIILKSRFMLLLAAMLTLSLTNAFAAETKSYAALFTIKSSDISGSTYATHTKTVDKRDWIITFGGYNKSVGTNAGNRSKCNLGSYAKYAVSPVTTTDVASAFVCKNSISDVSKISYTFNGGNGQANTVVYLIYSADSITFNQLELTSGAQGAAIASGTAYTFAKKTGYFGLLFKCTSTSTSTSWRIDDVNITFYTEPDMHDMLYFVGLNGNDTVRLNKVANNSTNLATLTATFEYSKDRINWTAYDTWATSADPTNTYQGAAIALAKGDSVFFRAKGTNGKNATMGIGNNAYFNFAFGADDSIAAGGSTMSLYDASCEQDSMTAYGFYYLFTGAKQLVSAPKLPAAKLAKSCYQSMFQSCTALTSAPALPALILAPGCYNIMFYLCTSLVTAPELPATTLINSCYMAMFKDCTSLTKAPELTATTLNSMCYSSMFQGCTSLEVDTCTGSCDGAELVVPSTGADRWNKDMFFGCKGDAKYTGSGKLIQLGGHYCIKEYKQTPVAYIDANGNPQSCTKYTVVEDATAQVTWNAGWYVVTGDVTLSAGAVCNGAVNLILADGAVLTATGTSANAGIQVSGTGTTLTIFGQTDMTGKLYAQGGSEYACGIGRPGTTDVQDGSIVVAGNWVVTVWTATTAGTVVTHSTTDNIASGLNGKQFVAIAKNVTPTAIQSIRGNNADQPVKFIQNGQLIIIRNGKMFNAQGAVVE